MKSVNFDYEILVALSEDRMKHMKTQWLEDS